MELVVSPWASTFDAFARSIQTHALLVAPFITGGALRYLAQRIPSPATVRIDILTNLSVENMIQGATNPRALVEFFDAVPSSSVRHLPGLHAKVYIADQKMAMVTSANLTHGGLHDNYEYGIRILDPQFVRQISEDVNGYGSLGADVSYHDLQSLASVAEALQDQNRYIIGSTTARLREEFQLRINRANDAILELRASSAVSTNSIFSRTILFLLRNGPLTTEELHPLIKRVHPDLCDDTVDRVINGVHFGKRWKHLVRNAQQNLKRKGLITSDRRQWRLP